MKNIDIWIDMKKREAIVCILQKILATENIVNLKIRKCHWNIEWSHFSDAHKFFEELYESSAEKYWWNSWKNTNAWIINESKL